MPHINTYIDSVPQYIQMYVYTKHTYTRLCLPLKHELKLNA